MRLAIFLGSVIGLILLSRYCTIPAAPSQQDDGTIESIEPSPAIMDDEFAFESGAPVIAAGHAQPVDPEEKNSDSKPHLSPPLPDGATHAFSQIPPPINLGNAKNVLPLVRAEYELPRDAVDVLLQLETEVLVEMLKNDSGHPATTKIQVTTDEKTQRAVASFLSVFYPLEHINRLKENYDAGLTKNIATSKQYPTDTVTK